MFRVGVAYAITSWVLMQVADLVLEAIEAPAWILKVVLLVMALGFVIAILLAWAYELTPDGIKREKDVDRSRPESGQAGRKLDRLIIVVLALVVGFLLYRQLSDDGASPEGQVTSSLPADKAFPNSTGMAEDPDKSVAVLPFVAMSNGEDDEFFADGLTEEILNSLAQLPGLMVTARTSSFHFKGRDLPVQEIARQLGVASIVEGSVRRSGDQVRVAAQLVRADDGFHLWSDTFDGAVSEGFDMQSRIAEMVARALNVVLDDQLRERMRMFGMRNPEAFVEFQKGMELFTAAHGAGSAQQLTLLRDANVHFERVMELVPSFMGAYQRHSDLFTHIALDFAGGEIEGGFEGIDIEVATRAAQSDFQSALQFAPDEWSRAEAALDVAIVSGNWRGLSKLIDRALGTENCSNPIWGHIISAPFGKVDSQYQDALRDTQCDPLRPGGHVDRVLAAIWQGDFAKAVNDSTASLQVTSGDWLSTVHVSALLAAGEQEQAEEAIHDLIRSETWALQAHIQLAAARGDEALMESLVERAFEAGGDGDGRRLIYAALSGNHQAANRHAALIDARPFGPMKLAQVVYTCLCAAPLDLEFTPNFAARIEESGLDWPPPATIRFPLKDRNTGGSEEVGSE